MGKVYIVLVSIVTVITILFPYAFFKLSLFFLLSVPVFVILFKSKLRSFLIIYLASFAPLFFLIALFFRKLRDHLLPPQITDSKIIGYTHFFGYPFYLDNIIFFIIIFYPLLIFLSVTFYRILQSKK